MLSPEPIRITANLNQIAGPDFTWRQRATGKECGMNNISSIPAAGVQVSAARFDASAVKVVKATTPGTAAGVDPASAMVDLTHSQVSYTASLNTLRTTNKMMMGYLLNINV